MDADTAKRYVAEANRILFMEGLADNVGHVSMRDDEDVVHINPHTASRGEVRPEDIIEIDLDGRPLDEDAPRPVDESPIHTSVYRHRDDIDAVLHVHPPLTTLFSVSGTDLRPVWYRAAMLGPGPVPVFDLPDKITTREEGEMMVEAMGDRNQVIMRAHGGVVADETMEKAVARAIFLEQNAYFALNASILGNPNALTSDEIERIHDTVWRDRSVRKVWHFYTWKARQNGLLPDAW